MTLTAGTKLGRYEIRSQIGEGGMGEVYRAFDPKINRDVAIKILPQALSTDKDRLARFEQEAQARLSRWAVNSFCIAAASGSAARLAG